MDLNRRQLFQIAASAVPDSRAAELFQPITKQLAGKEPLTWVFTGDSITHGPLPRMGYWVCEVTAAFTRPEPVVAIVQFFCLAGWAVSRQQLAGHDIRVDPEVHAKSASEYPQTPGRRSPQQVLAVVMFNRGEVPG